MSAFKKVGKSDHIRLRQRGGAVVFLESNDDFEIIAKRWFFDFGQDVHFESADQYETGTGGGGCQAVIQLVAGMRSSGIAAFGIVDRDVLLGDGHWTLWWSIDDAAFQSARPYGDWIRVLLRWELENYLLDPDAMAYVANNAPRMTSLHSADSVTASCLG